VLKVTANMAIHISHANRQKKMAMRMRADRLLVATPGDPNPRWADAA